MPEMISMLFFALWAVHTMRAVESRWAIGGAGLVLLISTEQFTFCSYPRFQNSARISGAGALAWRLLAEVEITILAVISITFAWDA